MWRPTACVVCTAMLMCGPATATLPVQEDAVVASGGGGGGLVASGERSDAVVASGGGGGGLVASGEGSDVRTAFAVLDADGNGELSADELRVGMQQLSLALTEEEITTLLRSSGGTLSESSFAGLLE